MEIPGKTVVITGASSGIGLALARVLAGMGATVFSFDRKEPEESIAHVTHVPVDVTAAEEIRSGFERVGTPVDILVSNAGVIRRGTIIESSEEDFDLLFAVNVKGAWLTLKTALPFLSPDAVFVQMSSRYACNPVPNPGLYALSKLFQRHLMEIAKKTLPQMKVAMLFPGPVDTPLARHDVTGEALQEKKTIMESPQFLAGKIVELLQEDKEQLLYDEKTRTYRLE